jgi:hypothetical protein
LVILELVLRIVGSHWQPGCVREDYLSLWRGQFLGSEKVGRVTVMIGLPFLLHAAQ